MEVCIATAAQAAKPDLPWPVVIGIFVATTAMIVMTRRRTQRSAQPTRRTPAPRSTDTTRRQIEGDLHAVMIELESLARQVNAQIETKYRKLEAVIRDADARIAELRRLEGTPERQSSGAAVLDVTVGADDRTEPAAPTPRVDAAAVRRLADAGTPAGEIARQLGRPIGEVELILALRRPHGVDVA